MTAPFSKDAARLTDQHVGQQLRQMRITRKLSQERLAEHLGLTFQQVQKYEKGTNRLSASRLWQCCEILEVEPSYFFEGLDHNAPLEHVEQLSSDVVRAILRVQKMGGEARNLVIRLAAVIADEGDGE